MPRSGFVNSIISIQHDSGIGILNLMIKGSAGFAADSS